MQWNTARFILTLKEKYRGIQTAVNDTPDATKDLVDQVAIKKWLEEKCLRENINFHEIMNDEDSAGEWNFFDSSALFDHVNSQYL